MYLEYRGVTTTMQEVKKITQQSLNLIIQLLKDWWINPHTLGLTIFLLVHKISQSYIPIKQ